MMHAGWSHSIPVDLLRTKLFYGLHFTFHVLLFSSHKPGLTKSDIISPEVTIQTRQKILSSTLYGLCVADTENGGMLILIKVSAFRQTKDNSSTKIFSKTKDRSTENTGPMHSRLDPSGQIIVMHVLRSYFSDRSHRIAAALHGHLVHEDMMSFMYSTLSAYGINDQGSTQRSRSVFFCVAIKKNFVRPDLHGHVAFPIGASSYQELQFDGFFSFI